MKNLGWALLLSWAACQHTSDSADNSVRHEGPIASLDRSLYRQKDYAAVQWARLDSGQLLLQIQTTPSPATWPEGLDYEVRGDTVYVSVQKCVIKWPCPVDVKFQTLKSASNTPPLLLGMQRVGLVQQAVLPAGNANKVVFLHLGNEVIYPVANMPKY